MSNTSSANSFATGSIAQAVLKNAIPAMAAMIMVLIYNLADTFFIGMTGDALQVAAVSLATPVFLIFMAVGTIFGIGGTSVISRALGEKREAYAKRVCAFCMWGCVGVGIIMTVLFLLFMDPILSVVGASAETWDYTKSYLTIVSLGGVFVLIANCFSSVVRAEGKSLQAVTGQIIGNLLNVVLDPLMILTFGWDITGAAIATLIGNVCGALYYILFYVRGKSMLSVSIKKFTVKHGIASRVLVIGVPAALGSLLMSVSQILINGQIAAYGDMAVAAMGVAMKVVTITGMLCIGLGQGVQPLLGYCVGARLWDRFKKTMHFSLTFALVLGCALTALCYLFCNQIVNTFLTDPDAYTYAVSFARILLTSSPIFGILYVLINAMQAMGAATPGLIISLSRQGIIFIPALFIMQALFGITGLIWAQPVADYLSLFLGIALYLYSWKKLTCKHPGKAASECPA